MGLKKIEILGSVYNNNVEIIKYFLPSSSIMVNITLDGIPKVRSFLGTSSTPNVSSDSSVVSSMNTNMASTNVWSDAKETVWVCDMRSPLGPTVE